MKTVRQVLLAVCRKQPVSVAVCILICLGFCAPTHASVTITGSAADRTQFLQLLNTKADSTVTANEAGVLSIADEDPEDPDNDFTDLVRAAIEGSTAVTLALGRNQPGVFVGGWQPAIPPNAADTASNGTQVLDLADIKALANPHSAACGIIHELWEVYVANRDSQTYAQAHPRGIGAENKAHAKQGKDARDGETDPGITEPPAPSETCTPAREAEATDTAGFYVYVAIGSPDEFYGWVRLQLEFLASEDPTIDRIAFGWLGPNELGPDSLPAPEDGKGGYLNDVYLADVEFLPTGQNDCNGNDLPDGWDIRSGDSGDCNCNAVPDECDIAGGTSDDANDDGIPDECQAVIPATSPWGLIAIALLSVVAGVIVFRRRRAAPVA